MHVEVTDDGDAETHSIEEAVEERVVASSTLSLLATHQAHVAEGTLTERVRADEAVTERALEEDVFYGRVLIPGWFINNDDELADHYGSQHDGATVAADGLVEDYSDKAVRIVAEERDTPAGHLVHQYAWNFLPKSVVTVTRVTDITTQDDADEVSRRAHAADIRRNYEWVWERGDERPSLDADDLDGFATADDIPDDPPEFEPGERVKGRFTQPTGWKEGEVVAVTPMHGGEKWTYHVHHDGHAPGEADPGAMKLRSLDADDGDRSEGYDEIADGMLGVLQSAEQEYPGDSNEAVSSTLAFGWKTYVNGYRVSKAPSINDDGELKGIDRVSDDDEVTPPADNEGEAAL